MKDFILQYVWVCERIQRDISNQGGEGCHKLLGFGNSNL